MTWDQRSFVGLFQAIFYVPALLVAAYLLFHKHGRPRMPWISLTIFSTVRLAGGIILIVYENNRNSIGLTIVAILFQGTGVIPLIVSSTGMLRIMQVPFSSSYLQILTLRSKFLDYRDNSHLSRAFIIMRILFLAGIVLLIAGSVELGNYNVPSEVSLGLKLAKAGYIILVVIIAWLAGFDVFFWTQHGSLSPSSQKVLRATTLSVPFLIVRIVYGCLGVFQTHTATWSTLSGSVAALVVMHSLMEYAVVIIYTATGFILPPIGKESARAERGEAQGQRDGGTEEQEIGQWK